MIIVYEMWGGIPKDTRTPFPSIGAIPVTMLTECANVSDIRYEFSLVSMVFGV